MPRSQIDIEFLKANDMRSALILFAAIIAFAPVAELQAAGAERPNILYFYVDDMGWGSIGPNGQAKREANGQPYVRTPNIDRLAAQGINFTRGYGCHVCSPARSSQQSGFHQGHTFADRNDPDNAKKAMRADDMLMGDMLSAAGYTTGYWGKWGYGGSKNQVDPTIENIQTLPTSHGYQNVLAELHHVRAHTFFQPTLWSAPAAADAVGGIELVANTMARFTGNPDYPATPALHDHDGYPKVAYCDDHYAFAALEFVRAQAKKYNRSGEPFFGLLAVQIPHAPFGEISELPEWDKDYAGDPRFASLAEQTRQWAAMVTRIDAHFGNILAALEDPNNDGDRSDSIADNTLVVFQSDNGGPAGRNNVQLDANGGLRGHKGQIYEGGIRVPLVMRWPAKITTSSKLTAGTNCGMVVDVTDLLPTFCELAGISAPLGVDGVSIAPTLSGSGHQRRREFLIHEAGNGQSIIRGDLKLVRAKRASLELYNLKTDPAEENDISAEHPEKVQELEALLLGERVTEPRGFANTYHHWTGEDGATTSNADNWSDYRYENAGKTYMFDDGAPRLSWTARIENSTKENNVAKADADLEFLGLEIRGNAEADAMQALVLGPKIDLVGRNEIRLESHSRLTVDNGTISSLRWVKIRNGAVLSGTGTIDSTVYNNGTMAVTARGEPRLRISANYYQTPAATLSVSLTDDQGSAVSVAGEAHLAGQLEITTQEGFEPTAGTSYTIVEAKQINGTFANPLGEVAADDGSRFKIDYTRSSVVLTAK